MADLLAYGEDIIGFPGGEATAKVKLMKLLWENPDPTQAIDANTEFNINTAGYDLIMVISAYSTNYLQYTDTFIMKKGRGTTLNHPNSDGTQYVTRNFNYVSDTKYSSGTAYRNGTADSSVAIPLEVYGIKLEQEIPVVAENVSTLAANCLLSDGETSVEDCVEDSGWIQIDTTGVYYRKIGKQVTIKGSVTTGTSWTTVATLPEGCRPGSYIYRCLRFQTTSSNESLFIGPTGVIQTVGTSPIQFMESFLID